MPGDKPGSSTPQVKTYGTGANARYGLLFFIIYLLLYGGFVGISAFAPDVMSHPLAGVNVAVIYGFGLIIAALVLALLYMRVCNPSGEHRDTEVKP